jgi:hypothetical protein
MKTIKNMYFLQWRILHVRDSRKRLNSLLFILLLVSTNLLAQQKIVTGTVLIRVESL